MSDTQTVKVENYPSYEVQLRRLLRIITDQDAEIQRLKGACDKYSESEVLADINKLEIQLAGAATEMQIKEQEIKDRDKTIRGLKEELYDLREALYGG